MKKKLKVPCTYQGGKQRIAPQIVDILLKKSNSNTVFYDLCCGSGAISLELANRGINAKRIKMLDKSSWGAFWSRIGSGTFNLNRFRNYLSNLPCDKEDFKQYFLDLSKFPVFDNEAELYPILQSNSFGGKQIYRVDDHWANAFFRDYWKPTMTSIRRSPANPMQPSPKELINRVELIANKMIGVLCLHKDIMTFLEKPIEKNAVVYVDPPYQNTTGYGYNFDIMEFVNKFKEINDSPLFVSDSCPLSSNAIKLDVKGSNGGITGLRKEKHNEWLSSF